MNNEDAIRILLNSNEYHHAKGDLPHSAASIEAFNKAIDALKAERQQDNLICSLTELCNRYCKNCPVTDTSNWCTDCICTHIRGIIGEAV